MSRRRYAWAPHPALAAVVMRAMVGLVVAAALGITSLGRTSLGQTTVVADDGREPVGAAPAGVLDLADGGFLAGTLVPCPDTAGAGRRTVLWSSPHFTEPFEFLLDEISGVRCAAAAQRAAEAGRFLVHLRGGDTISGSVEALDADTITLGVGGDGRSRQVRIDRGEVESICRRGAGGGSFTGPGGLGGWQQSPQGVWREEAGRILAATRGASVSRDIAAPMRARYDLVLSWKKPSEFRLAVGAAANPDDDDCWLEMTRAATGEATLMIARREPGAAVLAPVPMTATGDWMRVVLFVDRQQGRLAALVPGAAGHNEQADPPADVVLPPAARVGAATRLRLTLTSGDLCLESVRVTAWNTADPTLDEAAGTVIASRAGRMTDATVEAFDAATDEFVVRRAGQPERLAAESLDEITFPAEAHPPEAAAAGEPAIRVICADGDMLSGDLMKVDDGGVWLRRRGIDGPLQVPFTAILAVKSLQAAAAARELPGRAGRLLTADASMQGCLVGSAAHEGAVAWQPRGSVSASRFAAGGRFGATLEYVESRARRPAADVELGGIGGMVNRNADGQFIVVMLVEEGAAAQDGRLQSGDQILAIAPAERSRFVETRDLDAETVTNLLRGRVGTPVRLKVAGRDGGNPIEIDLRRGPISIGGGNLLQQALETHARLAAERPPAAADAVAFPALVILRDGDVAACRVSAIVADGVHLSSPLAIDPAVPVVVPGRLVKAVELIPETASLALDRVRVERLLTVPRMQRARPPTHLLRLVDGDYLRGRLVSLDADVVQFELLERVKEFPRDDVARIIWLHPEGPADDEPAAGDAAEPSAGLPVQAVWANGRRVGFSAAAVAGATLRGRSAALGPIGVAIGELDSLRFGNAIGQDDGERPYARWILEPAREPRPAEEAAPAGAGPAG